MESRILNLESGKQYVSSVKQLEVYKKAYSASLEIHQATLAFPKIEEYALADQLRRSTKSICANLAEGYARQQQSRAEFKRFIALAIGSCNESLIWLDYAVDLNYVSASQKQDWQNTYESVLKMLIKLRNGIKDD